MARDCFRGRIESLGGGWSLAAFNASAVAEAMDIIRSLESQSAGRQTLKTREGEWKSWDPDVYGVDMAAEAGYLARLRELHQPIILLTEESERVEINLEADGEPLYCISDPFDGSWLFKRRLAVWWYTALAFYAKDFTPLCAAVGDVHQRRVVFADQGGAYLVTVDDERLSNQEKLDEAYRRDHVGGAPEQLKDVYIASHGLKPVKFLKPLLERYGELICSCKMLYPTAGPFAFAELAMGHTDVFLAVAQPYYDVFSGLPIAAAAGLVVTDFAGRPFRLQTDDCRTTYDVLVSRNQRIHDLVLEKLASVI